MRKRTYRALIILSIVVIVFTTAISIGSHLYSHTDAPASTDITAMEAPSESDSTQYDDYVVPDESPASSEEPSFEIHFFDVGEADSSLIECDGHYMLIDGGNPSSSSFLYSYLEKHGIKYLDYIICSHPHTDHVGGLAGALNYASVGIAYAPVTEYDGRSFNSFVKYLGTQNKDIVVPTAGNTIELGSAIVTFLGPLDLTLSKLNPNNASIIIRIDYGNTSFLFAGDAEIEEEKSLVDSGQYLHSTLLKVGHHGSSDSSSDSFLSAVNPEYAVISVGTNNEYCHPHDETLNRLYEHDVTVYRTDLQGEIVCYSDGEKINFEFGS